MKAEGRRQKAEVRTSRIVFCLLTSAFCLLPSSARASHVTAKSAALSTAHPLSTKVGLAVLQRGGNAVDASVAVAFALAVVHPQAGNLGGGGFLIYYDASTQAVWTLDFREVAPLAATRDMFASNAKLARTGARAIGVPSTVAGLAAVHEKFGSQPWKQLLGPAIALAREGFVADAELASDVAEAKRERGIDTLTVKTGERFAQPELASTLQRIAERGARDFYEGDTAKRLVEGVRAGGGILGFRDLREYEPLWRAPLKLRLGAYDIYTLAPPSGGGIVIGETLNILASDDLAAAGFQTPKSIHLLVEAQRRAYIDRNKYLGDPFSARIPLRDLLSRRRAAEWRKSIDLVRATATSMLTEPATLTAEGEHTTHFTIADAHGNIAAITTSLGDNFGSGFLAPGLGFFLNNAMDDFTLDAATANRDALKQGVMNAIEPGKRPATSMSPTIILRDAKPYLALGTRGGPSIPNTIVQVFLNVVVYGKSLPDAVAAPRFHHQGVPEDLSFERERTPAKTLEMLNAMGHGMTSRESIGDVHALLFEKGKIIAVADPRRGGAAGGY
ncbi:MAG TPA: gamma-glutamyltransferase [Thermoanaerobaculia bacterium]|nr:gamma-glutamyltransferase [Thermoanaerobaculia bacterium]